MFITLFQSPRHQALHSVLIVAMEDVSAQSSSIVSSMMVSSYRYSQF